MVVRSILPFFRNEEFKDRRRIAALPFLGRESDKVRIQSLGCTDRLKEVDWPSLLVPLLTLLVERWEDFIHFLLRRGEGFFSGCEVVRHSDPAIPFLQIAGKNDHRELAIRIQKQRGKNSHLRKLEPPQLCREDGRQGSRQYEASASNRALEMSFMGDDDR